MEDKIKLIIYDNKSIFERPDGTKEIFEEGSTEAECRVKSIKKALKAEYLKNLIEGELKSPTKDFGLEDTHIELIKKLVNSVTSEVGRALIGITIMQLCVKSICPDQNIRLHKGGKASGSAFSWREGVSMRTLDKSYITPVLRQYDLLRLNADGFMMTRSLAENYPYTILYKAAVRGGKKEWLLIVEALEEKSLPPLGGLKYLISLLINRSNKFIELSDVCMNRIRAYESCTNPPKKTLGLIERFIESSEYSARAFEVVIHGAYQALDTMGEIEGVLKPLSQMRSANKKHGNIGDIEILESSIGMTIIEAWDTKYGKPDLREELEELSEKLLAHPDCRVAGFITNVTPVLSSETISRIEDITAFHDCFIYTYQFSEWYEKLILPIVKGDQETFFNSWLLAIAESLCQKRKDIAPIDEPCEHWIRNLISTFS